MTALRRTAIACLLVVAALAGTLVATQPASAQASDPTLPGPLATSVIDYDAGITVITSQKPGRPGASPQQLRGRLFVPAGSGPFPVVVLLHGGHGTCNVPLVEDPVFGSGTFPGETILHPCPATPVSEEIPNHRGYDYIGQNLASHGYLVAAIDANGINSYDFATVLIEDGQFQRAELVSRHLDLLHSWNLGPGPGAVGDNLVGKVDLSRIGLMGHSRGGEGAMAFVEHNRSRQQGRRYPGLKAVFALAPTNFHNHRPHGVNFATLLPLCDGDVFDLQGAGAYDDGRFDDPNEGFARAQYSVRGANHNYFNDVWAHGKFPDDSGFTDDSACDKDSATSLRLSIADQQKIGLTLIGAFMRRYVGGESRV